MRALQNQSRGSCEALKAIVRHFGIDISTRLAVFIDWTIGAISKTERISVQG